LLQLEPLYTVKTHKGVVQYCPGNKAGILKSPEQYPRLPIVFILITFGRNKAPIHSLVQYNLTELVQLHTIKTKVPENLQSGNGAERGSRQYQFDTTYWWTGKKADCYSIISNKFAVSVL
jgi:hypothetical protein